MWGIICVRDEFSSAVRESLAKRAGQRCSNPDCRVATSGPHANDKRAINVGVAAHISAASLGGPRHNPNLSPEERADITNGIWLCQNCAKLIDSDTTAYPDTLLIMWKRRHGEFIKGQMLRSDRAVFEQRGPGILDSSGAFIQWSADGKSCVVDLRVSNLGNSDLLINGVEFTVLESFHQFPMGQAGYSALYDLDISDLAEFSSHAECRVAQILA